MALEEPKEGDYLEEQEGLQVGVDQGYLDIYKGFNVDFKKNWFSKGFVVRPRAGGGSC